MTERLLSRSNESPDPDAERRLEGALPCPFCGGTEVWTHPGSTFRWRYAACSYCGAQCGEVRIDTLGKPRLEAVADADAELLVEWNKRIPSSESGRTLEEMNQARNVEIDRRDAARYRFIRDNPESDVLLCQDAPAGYNGSRYMSLEFAWLAPQWEKYTPEHFDRAVDDAMEKANAPGV